MKFNEYGAAIYEHSKEVPPCLFTNGKHSRRCACQRCRTWGNLQAGEHRAAHLRRRARLAAKKAAANNNNA